MNQNIEDAVIAAFRDHKDKGGEPYIHHCYRVAEGAEVLWVGSYMTGFLHDVVEDTSITFEDLYNLGVDNLTIERLKVLTRRPKQNYDNYILNIKRFSKRFNDPVVLAVKIADLNDNLNLSRLPDWNNHCLERVEKYFRHRNSLRQIFLNRWS